MSQPTPASPKTGMLILGGVGAGVLALGIVVAVVFFGSAGQEVKLPAPIGPQPSGSSPPADRSAVATAPSAPVPSKPAEAPVPPGAPAAAPSVANPGSSGDVVQLTPATLGEHGFEEYSGKALEIAGTCKGFTLKGDLQLYAGAKTLELSAAAGQPPFEAVVARDSAVTLRAEAGQHLISRPAQGWKVARAVAPPLLKVDELVDRIVKDPLQAMLDLNGQSVILVGKFKSYEKRRVSFESSDQCQVSCFYYDDVDALFADYQPGSGLQMAGICSS